MALACRFCDIGSFAQRVAITYTLVGSCNRLSDTYALCVARVRCVLHTNKFGSLEVKSEAWTTAKPPGAAEAATIMIIMTISLNKIKIFLNVGAPGRLPGFLQNQALHLI